MKKEYKLYLFRLTLLDYIEYYTPRNKRDNIKDIEFIVQVLLNFFHILEADLAELNFRLDALRDHDSFFYIFRPFTTESLRKNILAKIQSMLDEFERRLNESK